MEVRRENIFLCILKLIEYIELALAFCQQHESSYIIVRRHLQNNLSPLSHSLYKLINKVCFKCR